MGQTTRNVNMHLKISHADLDKVALGIDSGLEILGQLEYYSIMQ